MVEEHVGKKRRKEVRQAIALSEQMRSNLVFFFVTLAIVVILTFGFYALSYSGIVALDSSVVLFISLGLVFVVMIVVTPKVNGYWALRDQYKEHCQRYNISKEDIRALKNNEL